MWKIVENKQRPRNPYATNLDGTPLRRARIKTTTLPNGLKAYDVQFPPFVHCRSESQAIDLLSIVEDAIDDVEGNE